MQQTALSADDPVYQAANLYQFLKWFARAATLMGLLELIAGVLISSFSIGFLGILSLGVVGLSFWVRRLVAGGLISQAVLMLCVSFFGVILVSAILVPILQTVLVLIALMTAVMALPYLHRGPLARLIIVTGVVGTLLTAITQILAPSSELITLAPPIMNGLVITGAAVVLGLTLLLLWQFSSRLRGVVAQMHIANAALRDAQAGLEAQVAERTAELQTALTALEERASEQARLLVELDLQRMTIRELSVPVIPINAETMVMPLIGTLDDDRLEHLQTHALRAVERRGVRNLVLDITGVVLVDSKVAQGLLTIVSAAHLLGVEVTLVGIRPEVAQTIVGLGLNLRIRTFSNLQAALDFKERLPVAIQRSRL